MLTAALLLIITREWLSRESSAYVMWAGVLLQACLLTEHELVGICTADDGEIIYL